jgi:valyl-tRNA synthetase
METGGEILYPWVSRMLMLGLYVTGEVPFKAVYIHGYVMAADGSKMSKSIGNVVDPLPVIDEYGSDALRMGIVAGRSAAVNRGYDPRRVEEARNFCNKLWNIARYIEALPAAEGEAAPKSVADHWILQKLQQLAEDLSADLGNYRFAEGYERLYHFVWDDLADWYIEASKADQNVPLLRKILSDVLVYAHPYAPFLTETIWQTLDFTGDSLLATAAWPTPLHSDKKAAETFGQIKTIVAEARYIISALHAADVTMYYTDVPFLKDNATLISRMARLKDVAQVRDGDGIYLTTTPYLCWLDIDAATAKHYAGEVEDKMQTARKSIEQLQARLDNEAYVKRAPKQLVHESREQLQAAKEQLAALEKEYERIKQ